MAIKNFTAGTITLDEQGSIYYSGQVLSGTIEFELGEPLTFAGIEYIQYKIEY